MNRFLLAAAALTFTASAPAADWLPTSPLIQIGNDCDIYFDAAAGLEVTDNLFSSATKTSATSFTLTPGFLLEYGKDSATTITLSAKHTIVDYTDSALSDLNQGRDALSASLRFADGGPLAVTLDSSYRVSARNDDLQLQGVGPGILGATLVRQANYAHAFRADYKLTEKLSVGLGYANTFNQYLDPVTIVSAGPPVVSTFNTNVLTELNTKSMPLSLDFQAFEKLSFGLVLQHDVTEYSAAPYFNSLGVARPALTNNELKKDFVGLTAKGQLTESGKLNGNIRVGYNQYHFDNLAKDQDLSYQVSLGHSLTDRLTHSLTVSRDVTASSTNSQLKSSNYTYGVAYAAATDLNLSFSATKSDVLSGASQVDSYVYNLGADYKYSNHLSLQAGYVFADSEGSLASSSFQGNTFTLSAAFRY